MRRWADLGLALAVLAFAPSGYAEQQRFPGVGRPATAAEVKAWDIDVRPDFKGLPKGSGSVAAGRDIWDGKCASCHGVFGESNEVFTPIVGNTTAEDIKAGRVKSLLNPESGRTTLMKLAYLSTLWDYINRAMPWTAPKTLKTDEVYAVTAYILNLGDIVSDDFVLSDQNIADVQKRLPNRNGLTREHGLWDVRGKPDVKNTACMSNCEGDLKVTSQLPEFARTSHGNIAQQNRSYGPVRGVDTRPAGAPVAAVAPSGGAGDAHALAGKSGCLACHGVTNRIVGPGFGEIAAKYRGQSDAAVKLATKVKSGGAGAWGAVPMPPQPQLNDQEIKAMVSWILAGAR